VSLRVWLTLAALVIAFGAGVAIGIRYCTPRAAAPSPPTPLEREALAREGFHVEHPTTEPTPAAPGAPPRARIVHTARGELPPSPRPPPGPHAALPPPDAAERPSWCDLLPEDLGIGCDEETIELGGEYFSRLLGSAWVELPPWMGCQDDRGVPRLEVRRGPTPLRMTLVEGFRESPPPPPFPWSVDLHAGAHSAPGWLLGATWHGRSRVGWSAWYEHPIAGDDVRVAAALSLRLGRK